MDIISAGVAAMGTITVGVTGTGTTVGGGVTDTIIAGITATIIAGITGTIIITATGGNPSEKGRQLGGPFFLRQPASTAFDTALAVTIQRRDYLFKCRHKGLTFA